MVKALKPKSLVPASTFLATQPASAPEFSAKSLTGC